MVDRKKSKSTGPKTRSGKSVSSLNAVSHGLTSQRVLPDEVKMVDDFINELTAYYKPQSPLEILQIQRISFCRAKLAKLIDIEVAGREMARREIQHHPELIFEKLLQFSQKVKNLALKSIQGESVLEGLGLSQRGLTRIGQEIEGFMGDLQSEDELPKSFPFLCIYLNKTKFTKEQNESIGLDQRLMIFAEKVRNLDQINVTSLHEQGGFESALLAIERASRIEEMARREQKRQTGYGVGGYRHVVQNDLEVIRLFAESFKQLPLVLQSFEEMKTWMLRSTDLNAQESERMIKYQTMLEKRLSTAIGELLALQKIR